MSRAEQRPLSSYFSYGNQRCLSRPANRRVESSWSSRPSMRVEVCRRFGDQYNSTETGTIAFTPWFRRSDLALVAAQLRYHGQNLWLALRGAPGIEHALPHLRTFNANNVAVQINLTWSRSIPGSPEPR